MRGSFKSPARSAIKPTTGKILNALLREHRSLPCPWIELLSPGFPPHASAGNGSRFQDISPNEATGLRILRYKTCSLHVRSLVSSSSSSPPPSLTVVPPKCLLYLLALRLLKWGHLLCLAFGMASGNSRVTHGELRPVRRSVKPWKDTPKLDISLMVGIVHMFKLNIFMIVLFQTW